MSHNTCSCISVRPSASGAIGPRTVWILPRGCSRVTGRVIATSGTPTVPSHAARAWVLRVPLPQLTGVRRSLPWCSPKTAATISPSSRETNVTAPLIGYADRISVRAGQKIAFKVSSTAAEPYNASLIRIVRGDPNPDGPGVKFEDHSEHFDGRFPSREQRAWPGSSALIEGAI